MLPEAQDTGRTRQQQRKTRQKACNACIKAKRRCDLQHPSCRRCVVRGTACIYSSTRLHDHVNTASPTSGSSASASVIHTRNNASPIPKDSQNSWVFQYQNDEPQQFLFQSDNYFLNNNYATQSMQFFLLPSTWTVMDSTGNRRNRNHRSVPQLNSTVRQVQSWVKQWIEEGSNMFVHKRLYRSQDGSGDGRGKLHMPRCIQDAYTTGAAYFSSTEKNKEMVLGIVEERVATLLDEEGDTDTLNIDQFDGTSSPGILRIEDDRHTKAKPSKSRGVLDHLARVQALLVYQTIRLFDGDPRSRIMAESLIPVLSYWCKEMLDSALLSSQYITSATSGINTKGQASFEKKLHSDWDAWILAESVRRTWLVAGHMQCIYRLLSYGFTVCPGGLMFTTRAGLWQAESAYEWWAKIKEKDVLFCPSLESGKYLLKPGETSPDDVDDFGRFVLRIIEGEERVDKWLAVS